MKPRTDFGSARLQIHRVGFSPSANEEEEEEEDAPVLLLHQRSRFTFTASLGSSRTLQLVSSRS